MSLLIPQLSNVVAWEFPEDKVAGKEAFLAQWDHPVEMWIRAYAFTQRELVEMLIPAAKIAPQHIYVDHEQCRDANQLTLVKECAEASGIDVTIGTSPLGKEFIAHAKSTTGKDGRSWMGSWNFSESASSQVNHVLQFNSPEWRDMVITAFNYDVTWAWNNQREYQVQAEQPAPRSAA